MLTEIEQDERHELARKICNLTRYLALKSK